MQRLFRPKILFFITNSSGQRQSFSVTTFLVCCRFNTAQPHARARHRLCTHPVWNVIQCKESANCIYPMVGVNEISANGNGQIHSSVKKSNKHALQGKSPTHSPLCPMKSHPNFHYTFLVNKIFLNGTFAYGILSLFTF